MVHGNCKRHIRRREGNVCKDTIVFFIFHIHQRDVKILIGLNSEQVNTDWLKSTSSYLSNLINLSESLHMASEVGRDFKFALPKCISLE